jgi:ribosomal protein L30/L7E
MGDHGDNEMTPRDVENMLRMLGNVKETLRILGNTKEIMEMLGKVKKMPRCWDFKNQL